MNHSTRTITGLLILSSLYLTVPGCALLDTSSPLLGKVTEGTYTHRTGRFSCPLTARGLGLNGAPEITDAHRSIKTEDIPLHQRSPSDTKRTRIVSNEIVPASTVVFKDASGTTIEFTTSGRVHDMDTELYAYSKRGFTWLFDTREVPRPTGRMLMILKLFPWYEEGAGYMGANLREAFRLETNPRIEFLIITNIVTDDVYHNIIIQLPARPFLTPGTDTRDLTAIRDDISSRPELQDKLFTYTKDWLSQCHFPEVFK